MAPPADPPPQEIELSIDSRIEDVALLGAAVSAIAALAGFDDTARYHIELCLVEAATNCIRHAYHEMPGGPVRVRLLAGGGRIELRICDRGAPGDAEWHRRPPPLPEDPEDPLFLQEGGRGLFLMHNLMDEVAFAREDGWNVLTLIKRR
jgi:serine/threonine-protein kinase RsbW